MGLKRMLGTVMELSQLSLPYELSITELTGNERLEFEGYRIEPVAMSHSITCYGYAFIERERPGRLDRQKAAALGVPEGPLLGRLKAGESVTLPDGRVVHASEVLSPPRPGRRILIGGDNDEPERFSPYAGADLLVHEATYTQQDFDRLPRKFKHTTALRLGCAAKNMKIKALAATHFSARYDTDNRMDEIEKEIRECYDGVLYLASDLMQIEL
jgi:ribonuclease Z